MGNEWREATLGEFVRLQRGHDLTAEERKPGDYPVMGSAGPNGTHGEFIAHGPGVVIGRSGASMGKVHFTPHDYWPHNTCLYVTDFLGKDPRFVFYLLGLLDLAAYNSGSAQPSLNRNYIYTKPVRFPLPAEQRAIAHVLGTLDDKIELNRRMNRTLEKMAAAIFKSWFIDFDPVHAKAQGRDTGLPADIADLFPDAFADSELGEIPEGWTVGPLTRIATLQTRTVQPGERPDTLWEHYSIPAFDEGRVPKWERGDTIKSGKYAVPPGSVLASKLNPQFPRVWLPEISDATVAICSTEFMPFVPTDEKRRPYLYELIKSPKVQEEIRTRVSGSTGSRQRAKPKDIAVMPVLVPRPEVITAFCGVVDELHKKLLACRRNSLSLARTRDRLLPKLLSGEIELPAAEAVAEGAK